MTNTLNVPTNNPLFGNQWHFDLLGNIAAVWEDYTGVGVTVAVYDDGMDINHEDLDDNYDASLHYFLDDGLFNAFDDGHGTAVAGLIGAENNGIGGVGVAYDVSLTSVDFLNDAFVNGYVYQAIDHMVNFDIINMSYGRTGDYSQELDIGDTFRVARYEADAMYLAALNGRGGLGTIMVKAAGNDANNNTGFQSFGLYGNAQGEGANSVHFGITVGAIEQDGSVAFYSNYGANLLVSAGAGSYTTDLTGSNGYSSGNYANDFGGTSAATPVTAGVIALMLDANPNLGVRDVQMILALSSAMIGSDLGSPAEGWEYREWMSVGGGDGTWNGGDMTFHLSYGYGAVDAYAAVRMAELWGLFDISNTFDQQLVVSGATFGAFAIQDNQTVDIVVNVAEAIMIEHAYVTVDMTHSYIGDVSIFLITPDGTAIELLDREGGNQNWNDDWTFGVAALRGLSSEGDWTIEVSDDFAGDQGTVWSVEIEFFGMDEDANTEMWHFTDDFLDLASAETARRMIGDNDGQDDLINMVAVSGDVVANLGMNKNIFVDGAYWATQESNDLTSIATGDGNDRLTGNDQQNALIGGRGNDQLIGGTGQDGLLGGDGNDMIIGDTAGNYGTDESAQIYRLFNAVFGREPGQAGHQGWVTQLITGQMDLDEVAANFVAGAEFQNTYGTTTNTEFVTLLFQNVLGRPPADAGLNAWVGNIENGMSREEVVRRLSEAAENVNLTADGLEEFEGNVDSSVFVPRIYRLFEAFFGREPSEAGFQGWIDAFNAGRTFDAAIDIFMATPEFAATYGGTTNRQYIETLFTNVLGRPPADAGLDAWTANLDNGMTRAEVAALFVDGQEFINRTTPDLAAFIAQIGIGDADAVPGGGDFIFAGGGNNVVTGGAFADIFVFEAADNGTTLITDWEIWDYLQLSGFGFTNALAAVGEMMQVGDDVVFNEQGVVITFADTVLADIRASQIFTEEAFIT